VIGVFVDPIDIACAGGVPELIVHRLARLAFDLPIGQPGIVVGVVGNREHNRPGKPALLGPANEAIDLAVGQRAAGFVPEIAIVPALDIAYEVAGSVAPIVDPGDHAGLSLGFSRH
jgi:hypothetical protein